MLRSPPRRRSPFPVPPDTDFDLIKVNRLRELVRRGQYRVDAKLIAESLISDHLLWHHAVPEYDSPSP